MAVEDDDTLATFFDTDEFAVAAVFTPAGGGAAVNITVVLDEPQEIAGLGFAGVSQENRRVMFRKSEVESPAGGTITIDGTSYRVVNPELDLAGKIWTFGLKP